MKFTQKTLFQCFEKSRPKSTDSDSKLTATPDSHSSLPSKPENRNLSQTKTSEFDEKIFLLPVHVRQLDQCSSVTNPNVSWKPSDLDDERCSNSTNEFFQRTEKLQNKINDSDLIQLIEIATPERRDDLFLQYTAGQPYIDWGIIYESLHEYRKKAKEQNQNEQILWTEIYRPKSSKAFLGNHTRQIKRLNEWFTYWTTKLQTEPLGKIERIKRKRPFDEEDDDGDSNFSQSSSNFCKPEHPRLIFIHGSGTTSLVHAFAEEFNFKVTEINGSQTRSKTPLLKQLEQMTSHQLSFKRCPSDPINSQEEKSHKEESIDQNSSMPLRKRLKTETNSINSFFNQSKTSTDKENRREQTNPTGKRPRRSKTKIEPIPIENNSFSSVQVEKTSLILFDEIETLTDDDQFWSSLKKLLETAKKPIILTSNSRTNPEKAIVNLSKISFFELIHLETLDLESIECFVRLVLLTENLEVLPGDALRTVIQYYSGDLRRILNELQFSAKFSLKIPRDKFHCSIEETPKTQIQLEKSTIFEAMFFSRLDQRWNLSPLKTQFDLLTEKFIVQYEKSRRTLLKNIENDQSRLELNDTFKLFMQEQEILNIKEHPSFYVDYRPFVREICQNERRRQAENHQRFRHALHFRGCSLQLSDFEILSTGFF